MNTITALPLVTIAIPTFNQKWCLADAIESALQQDYSNLEIIIADDCSSENIAEIINKYAADERIRFYRNDKNLGRTGNYQKCLYDYAQGDWYLNLDGDDILIDKKFISKAVTYIQSNPEIVLVTAACQRIINDKVDYVIVSEYAADEIIINGKDFFLDLPTQKAWISHLTSLYNRKKALALTFYGEDILSSDYESLYRLIVTGEVLVFKKVVGLWKIHKNNESKKILNDPSLIINNFKYIKNAAAFAKQYITDRQVKNWENQLLKNQILAISLQFLLKKPLNYLSFIIPMFLKYPLLVIITQFRILGRVIKKIIKN